MSFDDAVFDYPPQQPAVSIDRAARDAVQFGVAGPEGGYALSRLREEKPASYARLDEWGGGALERIVQAYDSGQQCNPSDLEFIQALPSMLGGK